jgi:hypothetical protein
VIFPRPRDAAHVHDNRLGRALDARWTTGRDRLDGAVIGRAIQPSALELARLHTATPRLKGYGADAPAAEAQGPLVPVGWRRAHRPDLTPRRCGLTVTAAGIPVWGHGTAGHRRASPEPRFPSTPLRQPLPGLGAPVLVAARKCCAGETTALATAHRFRVVTLVPQTVSLRREWGEAPERGGLPRLWERPGRRQGECAADHGTATVRPYRGKTAAGARHEWPVRFLVVESPHLAKVNAPRVTAAQQAAQGLLTTLRPPWQRRTVACEAEARQAATLCGRALAVPAHQLTYPGDAEGVPAQRTTRGRPPTEAPRPQRQVWPVAWHGQEATAALLAQAQRERRFGLATHVLAPPHRSAADLRRADQGQPAVERSVTWAHNAAAIAPLCLETPTRSAALGCVSLLALRVDPLVERPVRQRLTARRDTWPDRPAPSQRPTARTVCQRRRHLAVVTLGWSGRSPRQVTPLGPAPLQVSSRLGDARSSDSVPHQNSP